MPSDALFHTVSANSRHILCRRGKKPSKQMAISLTTHNIQTQATCKTQRRPQTQQPKILGESRHRTKKPRNSRNRSSHHGCMHLCNLSLPQPRRIRPPQTPAWLPTPCFVAPLLSQHGHEDGLLSVQTGRECVPPASPVSFRHGGYRHLYRYQCCINPAVNMSTRLDPRQKATDQYNSSPSASFLTPTIATSSSPFPPQATSLSPDICCITSLRHLPRPGRENAAYGQYVPQSQASAAIQNAIRSDADNYNDFDAMYQKRPQITASPYPTSRLPALPNLPLSTAVPTTKMCQPPSLPRQSSNLQASIDPHDSSKSASSSRQLVETNNPRISLTAWSSEFNRDGSQDIGHLPTLYSSLGHPTGVQGAASAVADKHRIGRRQPDIPSSQNALSMIPFFGKGEAVGSSLASPIPAKSKRVRTGCLTCRERHLKCDSPLTRLTFGMHVPDCLNCRKGNRFCKRGLRLNFIDIQVKPVPYFLPMTEGNVTFVDESRLIASEYVGGARRYPRAEDPTTGLPFRDTENGFQGLDPHKSADVYTTNSDNAASSTPFSNAGHLTAMPQRHTPQQAVCAVRQEQDSDIQSTISKEKTQALPTIMDLAGANAEDERLSFYTGDAELQCMGRFGRHASKSSDTSSITSSMVPQGVGHSSTPSSHVGVGNSPGGASSGSVARLGGVSGAGLLNEAADGLPTPPSENGKLLRDNYEDGRLDNLGDIEDIYGNNTDTPTGELEYLDSPDEMLFMQVFVQNVGGWMDVLDKEKHFSRIIPFSALKSPMLLNAFLACGVKQLSLVNKTYKDDKALFYYNTATMILSRSLQNPDRNIVECATTAVVLHVYDIMSEKPNGRTSHITGARALIRECGWNASSKGIGAACFWLNISIEMLNCLAFNWPTAWDPDQWGLDLGFASDAETSNGSTGQSAKRSANDSSQELAAQESNNSPQDTGVVPCQKHSMETPTGASGLTTIADAGDEEVWVHRIFYIVAKVVNFRATVPRFQEPSPHDEQVRLQNRILEWKRLKNLCDVWNRRCPRSMRPFGYLFPVPNESTSRFPNIWLVRRAAVVGRLFYHTAMVLLHQVNPIDPLDSAENRKPLYHHAHQVCGIVAHSKDRGVAAVALRTLVVSAMVLRDPRDQDEVFALVEKISAKTCWRIERICTELQQSWGRVMKRSGEATVAPTLSPPGIAPASLPASTNLPPAELFSESKMGPGTGILAGHHFAALAPPFKPPCAPTAWVSGRPQGGVDGPPPTAPHTAPVLVTTSAVPSVPASAASSSQRETQMMNPLFHADFRLPDHPYKAFYRPPNDGNDFNAQLF